MNEEKKCLDCKFFAPVVAIPTGPRQAVPVAGLCLVNLDAATLPEIEISQPVYGKHRVQPMPVFAQNRNCPAWEGIPRIMPGLVTGVSQ